MTAASGDGGTAASEILNSRTDASGIARAAAAPRKPRRSATVTWINLCGLASFIAASFLLPRFGLAPTTQLILMLATPAVVIVALEWMFIRGRQPFRPIERRGYVATPTGIAPTRRKYLKMMGLAGSIAALAAIYWLFPLYRDGGAADLMNIAKVLWIPFVAIAPFYIWFMDDRMEAPEDGYFHVGLLLSGSWSLADKDILKQHALQWGVKAFFLPMMVGYLASEIGWLQANPMENTLVAFVTQPGMVNWLNFYEFIFRYVFVVDVGLAALGYVMTLKLFDSQMRSAEPTMLGWLVCLICYPPFWGTVSQQLFHYDEGVVWGQWLEGMPALKIIWSLLIIASLFGYVSSTVQFGVRFSNLTHRGILTNGPFRWLKHPGYLSKNISWWLVAMPFLNSAGTSEAIRMSLLLLCVNGIYFMRAKTEERHLSNDPVYREYLAFMKENDLFAVVRRFVRNLLPHARQHAVRGN